MPCDYSMDHYRTILERASERYWLPFVSDVGHSLPDRELLLIRHDIDISPWAALEMARLEHSLDVHTSYYVRLRSPYYNALELDARAAIMEIVEMGHEVGLHYEAGYFERIGRDPLEGIRRDIETLEDLLGIKTKSVSQHEPSISPVIEDLSEDYPCAYQRHLVLDIRYFADSGHHWREGCICTKIGKLPRIHTLIHPHSWVYSGIPWQEVLRKHVADASQRLSDHMEAYIEWLHHYLANRPAIDKKRVERYGGR